MTDKEDRNKVDVFDYHMKNKCSSLFKSWQHEGGNYRREVQAAALQALLSTSARCNEQGRLLQAVPRGTARVTMTDSETDQITSGVPHVVYTWVNGKAHTVWQGNGMARSGRVEVPKRAHDKQQSSANVR